MNDKPHVLIAGAGIGGLTAALALIRQGFRVTVYEQAKETHEVGAGVLISPNGMRVLANLGIADRVLAVAARPSRREVRLWNTGQAWPTFELNSVASAVYGQPFAWLYRPDLLEVLAQSVTELARGCFGRDRIAGIEYSHSGARIAKAFSNADMARNTPMRLIMSTSPRAPN